jgi:nucleotide-binding universal stress UspA family protein
LKKILVPIDGSDHAEKALTYALEMAEICDADVEVLTVVPEVVNDPDWMRDYTEKMRENGEEVLSKALRKAEEGKPGIRVSKRLEEGFADLKILEVADEGGFDIIIMGSRGFGAVKRLILGSISNKVVNQSEIPVLIVK